MVEMIFIVFVVWLLGRGMLRALYGGCTAGDLSWGDSILTGGMVIIGLAEVAHLGIVVMGRPFSDGVRLFLIGLLILLIISGILVIVEYHRRSNDRKYAGKVQKINPFIILFWALLLVQLIMLVTSPKFYLTGDMTVETVNSILSTNSVYEINPLTGQEYGEGMPLRLKILCLPTLYAICCELFGVSAMRMVWEIVPVLVLLGSYASFYTVAKVLFPTESRKKAIFMVFVALILWVGDYMYGVDGFGVMHAGYRGVSIRMGILLPYTFGLVLRKKWKLVLLCILAEACIVWTLYGMGACLFVTVAMVLVGILHKKKTMRGEENGR